LETPYSPSFELLESAGRCTAENGVTGVILDIVDRLFASAFERLVDFVGSKDPGAGFYKTPRLEPPSPAARTPPGAEFYSVIEF
jgi:hypothetical protein